MAYVAQHAFHHLEEHLELTAVELEAQTPSKLFKRHQETRAVDISYHVESFNFFSLAVQVVGIKSFRTVLYWLAGVQPSRYILWRFQGNEDREERNLILFCRHSIPVFTYTRFDSSSTTTLFPQRCPLDFLVLASWFRVSGNYRH